VGLFLLVFFFIVPHEQYCIFDPWIDTVSAPHYSEDGFDQIRNGMSQSQALSILGEPLKKSDTYYWNGVDMEYRLPEGTRECWEYTHDGACSWGDYAWLGRSIYFDRDGKVTGKNKTVNYN